MHVLKFMVTQRQGWTVIGVLVLLTGVLWGTSSPTTPYIPTPRGSDALIYSPMNNGDIYIYSKDMSGFYIARHSDFSPPIPIDRTKTYGNIQMEFLARSDMISVNDTTEGNVHVTQAHVIEWLKLYDGNTLLGTYTASDYNPSGYYESRWWPVAVALIAAGLLITSVALFVRRIRRKGASFVPST